jgi:tRNA U34 5-carboxymethylaminomethyl modifying GTPase MnmE/TrmE
MTSQAAVDVLIENGKFEPYAALAVAEAIDTAMTQSQIVTVPILDARLAELKADTRISLVSLKSHLERKIDNVEKRIDLSTANLEKKIEVTSAGLGRKIEVTNERTKTELERTRAELVRWVFLVMLGNVALSAGATAILNFLQHPH